MLSAGLVACGSDAPTPSEIRARIASDLTNVLRETAAAADGTLDDVPGTGALELLGGALGADATSFRVVRTTASRLLSPSTGAPPRRSGVLPLEGEEPSAFDPAAVAQMLNQTIFTDANHVGDGVFAIPADVACTTTTHDDLGDEITELDPGCVEQWDTLQPRIRVAEDGDALRFALQLGATDDEPLALALSPRRLALSLDLDEAEDTVRALAPVLGVEAPNASLSGALTGALEVLGAARVTASLTIDRALEIAIADDGVALDGPDALRLTSAAAPVLAVALDGAAKQGTLELCLGRTTIQTPGEDTTTLELGGLTARAALAASQTLQLTRVSLGAGTTTLSRNGQPGLAIDLNPDHGRALDVTITNESAGIDIVTVSPRLDVRLFVDHAVLGDDRPVYDVSRVLLDGSLRTNTNTEQVEVVSGTFAISTTPASYGFSATAGQCVTATEAHDTISDSFYTAYDVAACP